MKSRRTIDAQDFVFKLPRCFRRKKLYLCVCLTAVVLVLVLTPRSETLTSYYEPSLAHGFEQFGNFRNQREDGKVKNKEIRLNPKQELKLVLPPKEDGIKRVVAPEGHFMKRLDVYIEELERMRKQVKLVVGSNSSEWNGVAWKLTIINALNKNFLSSLDKYGFVRSLFLTWDSRTPGDVTRRPWNSFRDNVNLLVTHYYEWTCDETLYKWILTTNATKARYDEQYARFCETNMTKGLLPQSLEPEYFNMNKIMSSKVKLNVAEREKLPDHVFYAHIFTHGVITRFGYVISRYIKVVPLQCSSDDHKAYPPRGYRNLPLHDEVFTIAQFWGEGYYHRNMEMLPRIGPYLRFLQTHTAMRVHTVDVSAKMREYMEVLGMDPGRLTSGDVRARVIYLPQATGCGGTSQIQGTQLLAKHFREYAAKHFGKPRGRKTLVLVKRSYRRRLLYHDDILARMKNISVEYNLDFFHFDDMDLPNLNETIRIFNRAKVIVGPHGAGLSNMLFSKPGTIIVEGLCDRPHVNTCFQMGAHILGHRYHGIPSKARDGCLKYIHVPVDKFEHAVRSYLDGVHGVG